MEINLTLKFNYLQSIFANEEYNLLSGERIYFSKRQMLTDIFDQVPEEGKEKLVEKFPMVFELLGRTNMVRR
jgi:hypothetical protein